MQKTYKLACLLFVLLFALSQEADAQDRRRKRQYRSQNSRISQFRGSKIAFANAKQYITLGASLNALNYFGDIAPKSGILSTDISFTRPGIGISSSVRLGSSLSLRGEFLYGRLSSNDYEVANPNDEEAIYRYARNLQFRNNIKELSIVGVYDIFSNPYSVIMRLNFTPYVFAGVAAFHHNPKGLVPNQAVLHAGDTILPVQAGEWVALKNLQTEGKSYSNFSFSIPMGAGVRFRVSQILDLEAEVSYRFLFTDYLDDISTEYVDKGSLGSDLAKIMSDRSLEPVDVVSGENRFDALVNSELINTNNLPTYTGADELEYVHLRGYGQAGAKRGNPSDNDIFITTTIRAVIMIGPSPFTKSGMRPR
jgi:opacity protein-like surface antigen